MECGSTGDGVDHGAREVTVLGVKRVGEQPEFLNGVEHGHDGGAVVACVFHAAPVYHEGIGVLALAVHRHLTGGQIPRNGYVGLPPGYRSSVRHDSGLQAQQVQIAAPVQGQCCHFAVLDYVAKLGAARFHLHRLRLDVHRLFHLAHLQLKVGAKPLVDQKRHPYPRRPSKTGGFDRKGVVLTHRHSQKLVVPEPVGYCLAR